jgi:arabinofuranan 3-O-arabinosyltransferase
MEKQTKPRHSLVLSQPGLTVLFVATLFFGVSTLLDLAGTVIPALTPRLFEKDFGNYWIAARETWAGRGVGLFNPAEYQRLLEETFPLSGTARNWSYPPHFLLMIWPLAAAPYALAYLFFQLVTGALFWISARAAAPNVKPLDLALATAGIALVNINVGQNGFLLSAFVLGAVAMRNRAPVVAGLLIACLTVKPQLGLLIPLILLLERRFSIFLSAAVGAAGLVIISMALFGIDAWRNYFDGTADAQQAVLTTWDGIFKWMMPTLFGGLRALGLDPRTAGWMQLCFSMIVIAAVILTVRQRTVPPALRLAVYAAASVLVTPYAFVYDLGFVIVLLLGAITALNLSTLERSGLIVLAGLSPVVFLVARLAYVPAAPLMMLALFGWLMVLVFRNAADDAHQQRDVLGS